LHLLGRLNDLPRRDELLRWCVERQVSGFQGRINKPADACYGLWVGGALHLLGGYQLIEYPQVRAFLLSCQPATGGLSKWPNYYPDVMHTYLLYSIFDNWQSYLGLCAMGIGGEPGLEPVDSALVLSKRAVANLPRFKNQK
jgi:geranylgeranyl transferase type-1 subunit beta